MPRLRRPSRDKWSITSIKEKNKLVLNLAEVEFVDSSGLTAIVSTLKSLSLSGGEMVICGVGKNLTNLFKLTKLDRVFKIFGDENQAVDFLRG